MWLLWLLCHLVSGTPLGRTSRRSGRAGMEEVMSSQRLGSVGPRAGQGCPGPQRPGLWSAERIGRAFTKQGDLLLFLKKAILGLSQIPWEQVVSRCRVPERYLKHKLTLLEPKEPFALLLGEKAILPAPSEFHAGSLELFSIYIKSSLCSPQCLQEF